MASFLPLTLLAARKAFAPSPEDDPVRQAEERKKAQEAEAQAATNAALKRLVEEDRRYYDSFDEEGRSIAERFGEIKRPIQQTRLEQAKLREGMVVAPLVPNPQSRNLIGQGLMEVALDTGIGAGLKAAGGLSAKLGKATSWPSTKKGPPKGEPPTLPGTTVADEDEFYRRLAATEKGGSQWFTGHEAVEQTPEFKKFSEGLRVRDAGSPELIDDEGAVIRAFHGTGGKIIGGEFWVDSELGAHFGTPAAANARIKYMREVSSDMPESWGRLVDPEHGGVSYPVYLRIRKPYRMGDLGDWHPNSVAKDIVDDPDLDFSLWPGGRQGLIDDVNIGGDFEPIQEFLKRNGHDGVVYVNRIEDKGADSYIIFDPRQVKSITGNVGDFDPLNPDLSRAAVLGGAATAEAARRSMSGDAEAKPQGVDNPHGGT